MSRVVLAAAAGLAITLLALELLLRVLPVSTATMTGYHFDPDVLSYPAGHEWTVSTGWDLRNPQRLRSNNWGFASSRDFGVDPAAVALIGDSYVEASMLPAHERPDAQLESLLGGTPKVFGLGSPGTALLDHAQRVRVASEQFQVTTFVIWLEAGDARQALCGSGNVHSRCLDPRTLEPRVERMPEPSTLKKIARHSALAQYFFGQLKLSPAQLVAAVWTRQTPEEPAKDDAGAAVRVTAVPLRASKGSRELVDAVVARFFGDVQAYLGGRFLFVVDGRRDGPAAVADAKDLERKYLIERLRSHGVEVVDLEPIYAEHAARSRLSLEVGPYDRHLNGLGVRMVMTQVAEWLRR
jgi:hypothetical protein